MATKQTQNLVSLFFDQALRKGDAPFLWRKQDGKWQSVSWAEAAIQIGALAEALTKLQAQDAWDELNEEQQGRIEEPLKSRSDTTHSSSTTIPFLNSELSACSQHYKDAIQEMLELLDGQSLVTINATEFFAGRIETEEQLDTTLSTIKQSVEKLLAQGKKVLVQ